MFDQISPTYDRINRILSLGMDRRWRKKVASQLPDGRDLKVLDLATGTGDQLIALFESGVSIEKGIGIDKAEKMLQIAKRKTSSKPYRNKMEWISADVEKIPFDDGQFDVATFSFGIRNISEPLASLSEILRVLKKGGRCLILEFSLPPQPFRAVYLFYLRYLLPPIGGFLAKAPSAYRYLNETIESFPSGKGFCSILEQAGFSHISSCALAFGAVTLYRGDK